MIGSEPFYMKNKDWYEYRENDEFFYNFILKPGAPLPAIDSYIRDVLAKDQTVTEAQVREAVERMLEGTF